MRADPGLSRPASPTPPGALLGSSRTRASNIALFTVIPLLTAGALALFVWSLVRAGNSPSSGDQVEAYVGPVRLLGDAGMAPLLADARKVGSSLIDFTGRRTGPPQFIGLNQYIASEDGMRALLVDQKGNVSLIESAPADGGDPAVVWQSGTGEQNANRFVLGTDGFCYVLRANGSRAADQSGRPWQSPNQRPAFFRNSDPASPDYGGTFWVIGPFKLAFYDKGFVVYSDSSRNDPQVYPRPVPLWWVGSTEPPVL